MSTAAGATNRLPLPGGELPGYLPIAEHGVIGDLRTVALVGSDGTIDWYCPLRFDAPSVFAAILDRGRGGYYRIAPLEECSTKQLYFPDTNVLITRFLSPSGVGEVHDFMPIDGQELIRRVVCVRGEFRWQLACEPRFNYGRDDHTTALSAGGAHFRDRSLSLALSDPVPLIPTDAGVAAEFHLTAGGTASFVLAESDTAPTTRPTEADTAALFEDTVTYWVDWIAQSAYQGRWQERVNRSVLALKLLTYAPTGAIIAAATTSLPEQIGGGRNWDYRYVWVRDSAFTLYALLRLGFAKEGRAFGQFIMTRFHGSPPNGDGPLQPIYGIDGRTELPEQTLDHLEGYEGSAPVRIGNLAAHQLQLDIYGEIIDAAYFAEQSGASRMPYDTWRALSAAIEWLCENWDRPDEGVWETRGGRQHFTHSRLMSWVALDRAIRIAGDRAFPADLAR